MSGRVVRFGVVVVGVAVLAGWGCWGGGPSRLDPPGISASAAGKAAIKQYDTDDDGLIGDEELDKVPAFEQALENLDKNGDGGVSADEVAARIEAWQASKLARMSLTCTVTLRRQPLEGATVKFVPEKFLGDEVRTSTGVTDTRGVAMLSVPTGGGQNDPPGVECGFYRVEITKEGVDIPAKYNTETILGQEVAMDAVDIQQGPSFNLE